MLVETVFAGGRPVSLDEALACRERRVARQRSLLAASPGTTLVSVKLAIPGPVKTSPLITAYFAAGLRQIDWLLKALADVVRYEPLEHSATGDEAFRSIAVSPEALKRKLIEFEDHGPLGRLFDADVLTLGDDPCTDAVALSRSTLSLAPRRCLICSGPAHACARSRQHGLDALRQAVAVVITGVCGLGDGAGQ